MNCIPTCFSGVIVTLCLMPCLWACGRMRKAQVTEQRSADSTTVDLSLYNLESRRDEGLDLNWEIIRTEYFPPDSTTGREIAVPRSLTVAQGSRKQTNGQENRLQTRKNRTLSARYETNKTCETAPGKDPLRWRYLFWTIVLVIGTVLAIRIGRRIRP